LTRLAQGCKTKPARFVLAFYPVRQSQTWQVIAHKRAGDGAHKPARFLPASPIEIPHTNLVGFASKPTGAKWSALTCGPSNTLGRYNSTLVIIAACLLKLHLPGCASLKGKRGLLKPLIARLHREFDVAVAEVEHQDIWQTAGLAIVAVGNDAGRLQAELENILGWIEHNRPEVEVADAQIELR
jgi:uncharacterized protein YlxP (DUF503 family)